MQEGRIRMGVNWRQAAGEALLIFLGVGVALLAQAWWESESDRELEEHLLVGIRGDLGRDSSDVASAMQAARSRVAGADRLLVLIGDPRAGTFHPSALELRPGQTPLASAQGLARAIAEYESATISPERALSMVAGSGSMQRIDLSDATFSEAIASGQLNVVQSAIVRAGLSDYYFNTGRFGATVDNRVEAQWRRFREVLSESGLSAAGGEPDSLILSRLRSDQTLLAELKNLRNFALSQEGAHSRVLGNAVALISLLDGQFSR